MSKKKAVTSHVVGEFTYRSGQEYCETNHKTSWSADGLTLYCDTCIEVIKHKKKPEEQSVSEVKKEATVQKRVAKKAKKKQVTQGKLF